MLPYWDIDASVAEAKRTIARGVKAFTFNEAPHACGMPADSTFPLTACLVRHRPRPRGFNSPQLHTKPLSCKGFVAPTHPTKLVWLR